MKKTSSASKRKANEVNKSNSIAVAKKPYAAQTVSLQTKKNIDKKKANTEKNLQSACFDLPKCWMYPKFNVSRKLATYNFTIKDLDNKQAWRYMWH